MNERRVSAVFFDAMGTLITLKPWVTAMLREFTEVSKKYNVKFEDVSRAWNAEWRRVNREVREDETKPFRTVRKMFFEAFASTGGKIGVQMSENDISTAIRRVYDHVNVKAEPFPDVPKTLEWLRGEGYEIGVISDADADDLTFQLESAGLLRYFDKVTTSSEVKSYKPNKEIFEIALLKMKCKSSQACHIGDTHEFDVIGANNMGLYSILVTHGKTEINRNLPKPTYVIKEISEIVSLLRELEPIRGKRSA